MKTWIKLYTEILSDPKMGRMNDKQFRRTIELFLIAGKEDNNGVLPSLDDIAWMLHASKKEVQTLLRDLKSVGIVSEIGSEKFEITNFSSRQNSDLTRSEINKRYYEKSKAKSENKTDKSLNQVLEKSEIQSENKTKFRKNPQEIQTVEEEVEVEEEKEEEINTLTNVSVYAPEKKSGGKSEKHKFGSRQNVLLTDDEYAKLKARFVDADEKIENLSLGIASKGYKYKDHYATILNWARRDAEKQTAQPQKQPETTFGDIRNYFEAAETPQWDIDL